MKKYTILVFTMSLPALALNMLKGFFCPMLRFSSHGDPGVEQTKLGIKGFLERSKISFNKFRTSAESLNAVFTADVSEEALAKSELVEVSGRARDKI
jgi:hypothetical protein